MITKIFLRTRLIYFLVISCFILFGRSFSGISILSYRIGEWITALCLLLSIIFAVYSFGLIRIIRLVFNKKIKEDIYLFALKDKLNYFFLIGYLLFTYFQIN